MFNAHTTGLARPVEFSQRSIVVKAADREIFLLHPVAKLSPACNMY